MTDTPGHPPESPGEALGEELASLEACGARRFDPIRFEFIASLARRALQRREAVGLILENKAGIALGKFREEFFQAREETAGLVEQWCRAHPESSGRLRVLHEAGDFKAVKRVAKRHGRSNQLSELRALTERLSGEDIEIDPPAGGTLEEVLRMQEQASRGSVSGVAAPIGTSPELKSARRCREALEKIGAEQLLAQVNRDVPEDSGPLNPQMLVVRTLSSMQNLSPEYLGRFLSYIDTLFWLEEAELGRHRTCNSTSL